MQRGLRLTTRRDCRSRNRTLFCKASLRLCRQTMGDLDESSVIAARMVTVKRCFLWTQIPRCLRLASVLFRFGAVLTQSRRLPSRRSVLASRNAASNPNALHGQHEGGGRSRQAHETAHLSWRSKAKSGGTSRPVPRVRPNGSKTTKAAATSATSAKRDSRLQARSFERFKRLASWFSGPSVRVWRRPAETEAEHARQRVLIERCGGRSPPKPARFGKFRT
jgi:hypothetical protein